MRKFIMRLDDACTKMDVEKWYRMELLLDKYNVCPLVGIIPECKDDDMSEYSESNDFWNVIVPRWSDKNWTFAMHGVNHVFYLNEGGINPVNRRSEFAGLSLEEQSFKIKEGVSILRKKGINPFVFIAPAHTFDENTLKAIKKETDIKIISDTPAYDSYTKYGFTFVPQQSGRVRNLPFKTITFCYHPNIMEDKDFIQLEEFLKQYKFSQFPMDETKRKLSLIDIILMKLFYWRHR